MNVDISQNITNSAYDIANVTRNGTVDIRYRVPFTYDVIYMYI